MGKKYIATKSFFEKTVKKILYTGDIIELSEDRAKELNGFVELVKAKSKGKETKPDAKPESGEDPKADTKPEGGEDAEPNKEPEGDNVQE